MAETRTAKIKIGEKVIEVAPIEPETPEMEQLLAIGYPDIGTVKNAETIIKERTENPALYPFETLRRAQAFLEGYRKKSTVVSNRPGWRRQPGK